MARLDPEVGASVRPVITAASEEMMQEIQEMAPEYAWPPGSEPGRRMARTLSRTAGSFIDATGNPEAPWAEIARLYEEIGASEARKHHSMDAGDARHDHRVPVRLPGDHKRSR
jgi:hypothetical protein